MGFVFKEIKMQVGIISTLGGGIGRITDSLIRALLKRKEIRIVLFRVDMRTDYNTPLNSRFIQQYTPTIHSPLFSKIEALFDLSLKKPDLDIIHCNYVSSATFLIRYKGNLMLTMHGFPRPEVESRLKDKLAYSFEQWCLSHLPEKVKIVTISEYCRNMIKERYGLDTEVIYNGIDLNFFSPAANQERLKQQMGLQGKKVILFVGRLHALKDPITLVKAYRGVANRINDSVLLIVGSGPLKERILKMSSEYNTSVIIKESRFGTDLLSLYQCADLFVLPSLGESFGLVLAEAMACGCPSLASTSGACPEILGMKELLFEPKNFNSLAEKMIYLLQNPDESKKISEYLVRRAKMRFSYEEMSDKYYQLYRSILGRSA